MVPWKDDCMETSERKAAKYQDLVQQCSIKVRQTWQFPVKVSCGRLPSTVCVETVHSSGDSVTGRQERVWLAQE